VVELELLLKKAEQVKMMVDEMVDDGR